jgi:hypothetical protein
MEAFLRSFYVTRTFDGGSRQKRCRNELSKKVISSSRHIVWSEYERKPYALLRAGVSLQSRQDADQLYESGTLREGHFYLFCHQDPHLDRNALVPKYEAAYFFADSGEYVRVKKCHLKQAYQAMGRCIHAHMWTIDEQGLPYWVDRHAFSKKKQQRSKRKYEASKKNSE